MLHFRIIRIGARFFWVTLYSHILPQFFPIMTHTCFIIKPMPKFLTLLIYWQIQSSNQVRKKLLVNFIKKLKTKIRNGNTASRYLTKFSVFVDVRNNAFLLIGFTERM